MDNITTQGLDPVSSIMQEIEPLLAEDNRGSSRPRQSAQPFDETRESLSLAELSRQTKLSVQELYSRANGRRLLIRTPHRTSAAERRVYRDQIELVLAPRRGERSGGGEAPQVTVEETQSASAPRDEAGIKLASIRKLLKLTEEGHFSHEEVLTLITAVTK